MTAWEPRVLPWALALVLASIAVGVLRTYLKPASDRWHRENPWRG